MYYSRKKKTDNNYVVLKHPLRQFGNMSIFGVKFCAGYGVVVKDSKEYFRITRSPVMRKYKEFPLAYLKTIGFRTADVRLIFGSDIYYHFLDQVSLLPKKEIVLVEKETKPEVTSPVVEEAISLEIKDDVGIAQAEPAMLVDTKTALEDLSVEDTVEAHKYLKRCTYVLPDGTVCNNESSLGSPSGFCFGHIKYDAKRKKAKPTFSKGKEA
jgi:hypothetical protein